MFANLAVLQVVEEAQREHLRSESYAEYRHHCTRRIRTAAAE